MSFFLEAMPKGDAKFRRLCKLAKFSLSLEVHTRRVEVAIVDVLIVME